MEGLSLSMPIICELTLPKNDYRFYLQIFLKILLQIKEVFLGQKIT